MIVGQSPELENSRYSLFPNTKDSNLDFAFDIQKAIKMQSFANMNRRNIDMASPKSFIKDEPVDHASHRGHQQNDFSSFMNTPQHGHGFNQFSFHNTNSNNNGGNNNNGNNGSIDPSALSMGNNQGMINGFSGSHNNNNNNSMGFFNDQSSGLLADDDLLATFDGNYNNDLDQDFNDNQFLDMSNHEQQGIPVGSNTSGMFSQTPNNAPLESPFVHSMPNSAQFRHIHHNSFSGMVGSPSSFNASPIIRSSPNDLAGSSFENFMNKTKRKSRPELSRAQSHKIMSSSPQTPKTPAAALGGLSINTDHSTVHRQPILNHHMSQHHMDKGWDADYLGGSPMASPSLNNIAQISEMLKTGKHASLPTKVDGGNVQQGFAAQEAKRRRRRESHNLVERRRRDNINERIHELSDLVPLHRLEDEKVRKHLANNTPLSPGLASCSPPRPTSMLAGGLGRRASGVAAAAATFAPGDEKDKAPNKGDILNGAVGWTRDLMWALLEKSRHEKILRETIEKLGGTWPIEESEEMTRMESEVGVALEKNGETTFIYSRGPGSGLRVPRFTDLAGGPLVDGASDPNSRDSPSGNQQILTNGMHGIMTFKEEDEYDMDES